MKNHQNNKNRRFVISGYYGHNNFGDEAILKAILTELKDKFPNSRITVISQSPKNTKSLYQVNAIHKYNVFAILKEVFSCDVFISGGGSLFQDVTSFKSLCYYHAVLHIAQIFRKKTFIYAQGIGPLRSKAAKFLTARVFKKTDLITVRDKSSAELLLSMGIKATITVDPVWRLKQESAKTKNNLLKVGIQLRQWSTFNKPQLNMLADAVISNFQDINTELNLVPLQNPGDNKMLEKFQQVLIQKKFPGEIKLLSCMSIEETVSCISSMDLMLAMRYHAGLIAAKYCVPCLFLAYDPKVKSLAKEVSAPVIPMEELSFKSIDTGIKILLSEKKRLKTILREVSLKKNKQAEENIICLQKIL